MYSYTRHDIQPINMVYISQMFERNKDKSLPELMKMCDSYIKSNKGILSKKELVGTVDYMIDIMVDEEGKSSNRDLAKYLNTWQATLLGVEATKNGVSIVKPQEI